MGLSPSQYKATSADVNSVDEFVARFFPNAKRRPNGQYLVKCPAHADKTPSLSVGQGKHGGIILKCFAECSAEAICEALGITLRDLMPPSGGPEPRREVVQGRLRRTEYIYRDAQGEPLYKAVRVDRPDGDKDIKQYRWTGTSWAPGLDGMGRSLYRLPELIKADPMEPVYIVEGEKCVDALHERGLYATTSGGATTYTAWPDGLAEHLRGRVVIILPDNDNEGRHYADKVAESLQGVAARVSVLPLDGLGPKGDVYDWFNAGHNVEELEDLATAAPAWTPGSTPIQEDEPATTEPPAKSEPLRLRLADVWHRDLLRLGTPPDKPPAREYVLSIHPVPSVNLWAGAPGSKKSLFLAEAALCEASASLWLPRKGDTGGGPFFGDVRGEGRGVLWIDYDMGRNLTEERFYALARAHGVPNLQDIPLHVLSISAPMRMDKLEHAEELTELIIRLDARLVVIDTLIDVKGAARENEDTMGDVFSNLRRVSQEANCALDVIHHPGKNGGGADNPYRGFSGMAGKVDLGASITRRGMEFSQPLDVSYFKVRGAPPEPIAALFQWQTHPDDHRVLWEASFVSVPPSAAAVGANAVRATIRRVLLEHPGVGKTDAVNLIHSELKGQRVARNDVRDEFTRLILDGVIQVKDADHNKTECYWPSDDD